VRVESWDHHPSVSFDEEGEIMAGRPLHRRGESSSALSVLGGGLVGGGGEDHGTTRGTGINAGLTSGGAGRVTKARFEEGKNTEVGWGVVHLYRDGEETTGSGMARDIE
jgi:BRCA1-associated protein